MYINHSYTYLTSYTVLTKYMRNVYKYSTPSHYFYVICLIYLTLCFTHTLYYTYILYYILYIHYTLYVPYSIQVFYILYITHTIHVYYRSSINWDILEKQESDIPPPVFSTLNLERGVRLIDNLIVCAKTYTNEYTHQIG